MVGVGAAQVVDVQRDQGVIDQPPEELVHEVDIELTDPGAREGDMNSSPGRPERSTTTRDRASSSGT